MTAETIFAKIIRGEAAAKIAYQDDLVTAFHDIHPQAPVHILIVPNRAIATINDVTPEDEPALGRMFTVAAKLAKEMGIARGRLSAVGELQSLRRADGLSPAHPSVGRATVGADAGATGVSSGSRSSLHCRRDCRKER